VNSTTRPYSKGEDYQITNTQSMIVAAAIVVAGIIASRVPHAQSLPATAERVAIVSNGQSYAWAIVGDAVWICSTNGCKKGAPE
jgi:hypothetical protein